MALEERVLEWQGLWRSRERTTTALPASSGRPLPESRQLGCQKHLAQKLFLPRANLEAHQDSGQGLQIPGVGTSQKVGGFVRRGHSKFMGLCQV